MESRLKYNHNDYPIFYSTEINKFDVLVGQCTTCHTTRYHYCSTAKLRSLGEISNYFSGKFKAVWWLGDTLWEYYFGLSQLSEFIGTTTSRKFVASDTLWTEYKRGLTLLGPSGGSDIWFKGGSAERYNRIGFRSFSVHKKIKLSLCLTN
jgi:hypothetical protein